MVLCFITLEVGCKIWGKRGQRSRKVSVWQVDTDQLRACDVGLINADQLRARDVGLINTDQLRARDAGHIYWCFEIINCTLKKCRRFQLKSASLCCHRTD